MKVFKPQDIPDSHKIAVYDALCLYFTGALDRYYIDPAPVTDPRYDSGAGAADQTECVGLEMLDGELGVVMQIKGWTDNIGFSVELPVLTRQDQTDEGAWVDVA